MEFPHDLHIRKRPAIRSLIIWLLPFPPALERTFLGYLRTSTALTIVAVIIAQLFRLQHTEQPNKTIGFFVLGIPLSAVCIGGSILVIALGAYRFWRQQNAMLRVKMHAGGWDINAVGGVVLVVCLIWPTSRMSSLLPKGHHYCFCTSNCSRCGKGSIARGY